MWGVSQNTKLTETGGVGLALWIYVLGRGVERFLDESRRTNTESVTAARKLRIDIVFCINLFNVTILVHILSPHSPIFSTFLVLLPFSLPHTCEIHMRKTWTRSNGRYGDRWRRH